MNNQRVEINKENMERILQEMINSANKDFKIKLRKKLSIFDFQ